MQLIHACGFVVLALVFLPAELAQGQSLEQAATALTEGKLDAARAGFEKTIKDETSSPAARGLAWLGLAETALARKDFGAALPAWHHLATDATVPTSYRDTARRRLPRLQKGLPPDDPAACRARLPALPEPAVTFCVAPTALETGDGSAAKPFPTLARARDAIRALKKSSGGKLPQGGARVVIGGGVYPVQETFSLTAEDSATAEAPLVFQAKSGERPIFDGGVRIPAWRPVSDAQCREKLDPTVRNRVLEADLRALGVKDYGVATVVGGANTAGYEVLRFHPEWHCPELYCNGVPQTLARWPNGGFVKTGEVLDKAGKFHYVEDRPSRWVDEPDIHLHGYWYWDWCDEYATVTALDAAGRTFTVAPSPPAQYGYRKDQRYYAVNVFRELDRPGEWYLDRRTGMIYWLPPEGVEAAKAATTFSVLAKPFVSLDQVAHVVLLGLTFQDGRADGLHITGGADCLVAGCVLQRLGGDAIFIEGGQGHGVFGCTMQTLGCGGVLLDGGDLKTLTPGGHFIENCTVRDISLYRPTYTPAVHLTGCGHRVAHNLFERMPSSAMRVDGNDHLIELNTVRHVDQESDDQGGLDMFGSPLFRGVVIRWNRWSDIRGGTNCGAAGVRLDDMISGVTVQGNIFERCGAILFGGVQIHGGKDNVIDGNLFLDCRAGISFDRWGKDRWLKGIEPFRVQAAAPPYSTRYPELARLTLEPDVNTISRNVFARCQEVFLRDGGLERSLLNVTTDQPVDPNDLSNGRAGPSRPEFRRILFEAIPVNEIGPYAHPWRAPDAR